MDGRVAGNFRVRELRGTRLADRCALLPLSSNAMEHDLHLLRQLGLTRFVPNEAGARDKLVQLIREEAQRAQR